MSRDWYNIDLNRMCERDLNIIDPLTFEILLLEIECNIKDIDKETIRKQFNEDLNSRVKKDKEVFEANLNNIVKKALEYRNIDLNYTEEPYFK
jgi:hypothetical protein